MAVQDIQRTPDRDAATAIVGAPHDAVGDVTEREPLDASAAREHRKRRLTEALRLFGRMGWSEGSAGHLTARDPELTHAFWTAPYKVHFSCVRVSDLILVDGAGDVLVGSHPPHPAAVPFHGPVLAARPDLVSTGHAHTDHGRAMAALRRRVLPITQDACAFWEDTGYLDHFGGVVLDDAEGQRIAEALGPRKAVLLANHGLFTVGRTVEEMAWWFLSLEQACKVQLLAEAVGPPVEIPEPTRSETAAQVGSRGAALVNARPMFDWIAQLEPDMYD